MELEARELAPFGIFTADAAPIGCDARAHRDFWVRFSEEVWSSAAIDPRHPCLVAQEAQHSQLVRVAPAVLTQPRGAVGA